MITRTSQTQPRAWRSRWAAIGAAVAVTLGAGGLMVADAASSAPSTFVAIEPTRVLDTRSDVGLAGPFQSGFAQKLKVTGTVPTQPPGGLPAFDQEVIPAGATSVVLNLTVVRPGSRGFVSIRPGDASGEPATSNINFGVGGPNIANSVTVQLPTSGPAAGVLDIYVNGTVGEVLLDVAGYYTESAGGSGGSLDAKSNKKDNVTDPPAGTFGTAMSVTVEADSVGIIQIVGSVLVLTVGNADAFDCELTRTTGSNDDLEDTDRRVHVGGSQEGFCSTNGTLAVGPGSHEIELRVRKGQDTSLIDDGTLQALFIPGGLLDNSDEGA